MRVPPHVGFYSLLIAYRPAVICDVGSLDGQQALRFKRICPKATVVAFEANPFSCEQIRRNVEIQKSGVIVEHLAASDKAGPVDFHAVEGVPEQSSLRERVSGNFAHFPRTTTTVDAVRLDDYVGVPTGSVALWIDVEGAAAEALEGATGLAEHVIAVHVEAETQEIWAGQSTASSVLRRLRDWGLEPVARAPVVCGFQYDYLLIRADARRDFKARAALGAASLDGLSRRLLPGHGWKARATVALVGVASVAGLLRQMIRGP